MINVHRRRILAPTPDLLRPPRPPFHYRGAGARPSYYRKHARVESRFLEWLAERRLMCGTEKQSRVIL